MSYLVKLILFSLVLTAAVVAWNMLAPPDYRSMAAYILLPFFVLYSYVTHLFLTRALASENKNAFTLQFMGATGIKLFLSLIILVVFGVFNKPQIVPFAILYLFIYFAYTGFETVILFKLTKQPKN
jgi:hypothetical protein